MRNFRRTIGENQSGHLAHDIYTFKHKRCKDHYNFNTKVTGKLKETNAELESGNVSNARAKISESIDLLKHRNKLVKIADSSELGWGLVSEYVANPLSEDLDHAKHIHRAYSSANRKTKG
jgi:hypothetical protein